MWSLTDRLGGHVVYWPRAHLFGAFDFADSAYRVDVIQPAQRAQLCLLLMREAHQHARLDLIADDLLHCVVLLVGQRGRMIRLRLQPEWRCCAVVGAFARR